MSLNDLPRETRNAIAGAVLLATLLIALLKGLQLVALAALGGLFAVAYPQRADRLATVLMDLLRGTSKAKYGPLELEITQHVVDFSKQLGRQPPHVQALADRLGSEHLCLVLAMQSEGRYKPHPSTKIRLRELRERGLLEHNAPTMAASTEVWLTPLGKQLADAILRAPAAEDGGQQATASRRSDEHALAAGSMDAGSVPTALE